MKKCWKVPGPVNSIIIRSAATRKPSAGLDNGQPAWESEHKLPRYTHTVHNQSTSKHFSCLSTFCNIHLAGMPGHVEYWWGYNPIPEIPSCNSSQINKNHHSIPCSKREKKQNKRCVHDYCTGQSRLQPTDKMGNIKKVLFKHEQETKPKKEQEKY